MAASIANSFKAAGSVTTSLSFSSFTSTSGNTFVLGVSQAAGQGTTTPSDNKGNTFTHLGTQSCPGGNELVLWVVQNITGGSSHTVTVNWASPADPSMFLVEVAGITTASLDTGSVVLTSDNLPPHAITSGTLAQADEIIFTVLSSAFLGPFNVDNSFTVLQHEDNNNLYWTGAIAYKTVNSTSPVSASWTVPAGSSSASVGILGLKTASGSTTYSDGVTETASANHSSPVISSYLISRSESVTAVDTEPVTATFVTSRTEAGSATDSSVSVLPVSITESLTATSTETLGVMTYAVSVSEFGVASENVTPGNLYTVSAIEYASNYSTKQITFSTVANANDDIVIYNNVNPNGYQMITATASQTVFNTTVPTIAASSGKAYLHVFVNGVFQHEIASYTVTGANQITFLSGLSAVDEVVFISRTVGPWDYQAFTALSNQTVFNTSISTLAAAGSNAYLTVYVNGVQQKEGGIYNVTGANQITFLSGLISGDNVSIYLQPTLTPNYQALVASAGQFVFNTSINCTQNNSTAIFLVVFVNGIFQQEGASYIVTGTQVPLAESVITGFALGASLTEALSAIDTSAVIVQYAVTNTESVTATDTETSGNFLVGANIESVTATDTETPIITYVTTRIEPSTALDISSISNSGISASAAESLSVIDSTSVVVVFAGTVNEVSLANDIQLINNGNDLSIIENVNSNDTANVVVTYGLTRLESITASDSASATIGYKVSIIETGIPLSIESLSGSVAPFLVFENQFATDTESAVVSVVVSINESLSASESRQGSVIFTTFSVTETATPTDSCSATIGYAVSRIEDITTEGDSQIATISNQVSPATEVLTALDATSATIGYFVSLQENSTLADDFESTNSSQTYSVTESASVSHTQSQTIDYISSLGQSATATDSESISIVTPATITESVSVVEIQTATIGFFVQRLEALSITDTASTVVIQPATLTETVSLVGVENATITQPGSISESATAGSITSAVVSTNTTLTQTLSATDSATMTSQIAPQSVTETVTALDNPLIYDGFVYTGSRIESVTASDLSQISTGYSVSITELIPVVADEAVGNFPGISTEYAGGIARVSVVRLPNTRNTQITFQYGTEDNSTTLTSDWAEIYVGPSDTIFLNPVANRALIDSYIQNSPVTTNGDLLKSIINLSVATVTKINLA